MPLRKGFSSTDVNAALSRVTPTAWQPALRRVRDGVFSVACAGSRVQCPLCERGFRRFLAHGRPRRPNARCPGCSSLERHRVAWLYLQARVDLTSRPLRLLHVAPETCLLDALRSHGNVTHVTADLELPRVDVHLDLTRIPCRDDAFDGVWCSHVLEHVLDDRAAMREIHRVLKPGGWALLQVPVDATRERTYEDASIRTPRDRETHFGQWDHVRIYGRDYPARLRDAGFTVHVDDFVRRLPAGTVRRHALDSEEDVHFCVKPRTDGGRAFREAPRAPRGAPRVTGA